MNAEFTVSVGFWPVCNRRWRGGAITDKRLSGLLTRGPLKSDGSYSECNVDLLQQHGISGDGDLVAASMKVAVFGKPGGGKSTLSQRIAAAADLPLYQLDIIQFEKGGAQVPDDVLARVHAHILVQPRWVLDGFGTRQTFEAMLREASVLVYVERAWMVHYWWVTKRLLKSPLIKPLGWPEGSPILSSTFGCYRKLRLSPAFWNSDFKARLMAQRPLKRIYVIRHRSDELVLLNDLSALKAENE